VYTHIYIYIYTYISIFICTIITSCATADSWPLRTSLPVQGAGGNGRHSHGLLTPLDICQDFCNVTDLFLQLPQHDNQYCMRQFQDGQPHLPVAARPAGRREVWAKDFRFIQLRPRTWVASCRAHGRRKGFDLGDVTGHQSYESDRIAMRIFHGALPSGCVWGRLAQRLRRHDGR